MKDEHADSGVEKDIMENMIKYWAYNDKHDMVHLTLQDFSYCQKYIKTIIDHCKEVINVYKYQKPKQTNKNAY